MRGGFVFDLIIYFKTAVFGAENTSMIACIQAQVSPVGNGVLKCEYGSSRDYIVERIE